MQLVGDGAEVVVLVELDLVVNHPGADGLVRVPDRTPEPQLLLKEGLNLLT